MTEISSFSDRSDNGGHLNRPESVSESASVNSQNDVSTGPDERVNLSREDVNFPSGDSGQGVTPVPSPRADTGITRMDAGKQRIPLVRSGVPGAQGWMDAKGEFLLGPYTGTTMLDWALAYAQHGWHVFQMRSGSKDFYGNCPRCREGGDRYDEAAHAGGKNSCTAHPDGYARCHGLYAATRNEDVIRQWWEIENPHGNIGLNCGACGIALVDVDIKHHKGKYGDRSLAALEDKYGAFPEGPRAVTASGGRHLLFALPKGMRSSTGYTDDKGRHHGLGDWLDIKATGGLMVAAPSLIFDSATGTVTGQYVWENDGQQALPPLPEWVTQEIGQREQTPRVMPFAAALNAARLNMDGTGEKADYDEVKARVVELADEVRYLSEGGRNQKLLSNAQKCFEYAEAGQISHAEVESIFEEAGLASGLTSSEVPRTIRNARNRAQGHARPWNARRQALPSWPRIEQQEQNADPVAVPEEASPELAVELELAADAPQGENKQNPDAPGPVDLNTYEEHVDAFGINYPGYRTALEIIYEHKPDQMGISELFTNQLKGGEHLRWNDEAGKFYSYTGGCWNEDGEKHTAVARKVDLLGKRVTLLVDNDIHDLRARIKGLKSGSVEPRGDMPKDDEIKMLLELIKIRPNWYKTYRSAGGRHGIVEFIKTAVDTVQAEDMDADPCLMNFANGTYDVRTGQLKAHDPADYITHRIKHSLDLDLAEKPLEEVAPLFAKVLRRSCAADGEVPEDTHALRVGALKRGIGSTLHGSNPEKKMLVLKGASNTGKTVVMNTIRALIGSQLATESRPNLLIRTRNDRHESEEYKLKGRRLVLINELETKMSMDEGQVLRLVNPDNSKFTVRKLREQQQDINVTWSLVVTTNELLKARVTQQVLNRLFLYVLSNISVPYDEIDTTLGDRIMEQEAEAILAHLVMWWAEWYHTKQGSGTGLIHTDEMRMALAGFQEDNSSLAEQFKDEMIVFGDDQVNAEIRVNDLWSRYVAWHQVYHPNEELRYGVNRKQFYAEVLTWPGVEGVYKKNGTRPDGTPKQTLIAFRGMGVLMAPHGDVSKSS